MTKKVTGIIVPDEILINKIYLLRKQKVMLDSDLAELYEVETRVLKQAVNRNIDVFPEHFMFELTEREFDSLRSQIVISKAGRGGSRYLPMVFTEYGVLQLASVLRSGRAKQMSIRIIEVFVRIRKMLTDNAELRLAIEKLEKKTENNTKNIEVVFQYVDELSEKKQNSTSRKQIGYKLPKKK
jgi:hypothetical protein